MRRNRGKGRKVCASSGGRKLLAGQQRRKSPSLWERDRSWEKKILTDPGGAASSGYTVLAKPCPCSETGCRGRKGVVGEEDTTLCSPYGAPLAKKLQKRLWKERPPCLPPSLTVVVGLAFPVRLLAGEMSRDRRPGHPWDPLLGAQLGRAVVCRQNPACPACSKALGWNGLRLHRLQILWEMKCRKRLWNLYS